jgi:plasmid stabilization system protein ParE
MNIIYAPRALHDLHDIAAYLHERHSSGMRRVLAAIRSSIDTLEFFPKIGRLSNDVGHHRLPVLHYPYVVFYRISGEEILILHIRHTSREPFDPITNI